MIPRISRTFLALVLVGATAFAAGMEKRPLVAISPLQAKKVDPDEVDLISEALAGELQNTGAFRVMERSQMDRVLKEQGFQSSGLCDGNECAVEVGKVLGIDRMVVGSIGKIGSMYIINVRMVDVSTGEILASVRRTQDWELKYLLTNLVPQVAKSLASGVQEEQVAAAPPPPVVAAVVPAMPNPVPPPAPVAKSGSSSLPWILGGVALAGGGAAAYFLLAKSDESANDPEPVPQSTVSIPVTW